MNFETRISVSQLRLQRLMEDARSIPVGSTVTIFKVPEKDRGRAGTPKVRMQMVLVGHYPHFARFRAPGGWHECFAYDQLAKMRIYELDAAERGRNNVFEEWE